ncbi:MAG: cell division protein FtsQ/DivIB [Gracilimonas sp.]|uniref:cell division protein FtsQ/DivIB n=1 Tax=Gracilimonas TaxID=649462 RepID=UPI001B1F3875|nr:cell division protein FtsQ/DivIB [Gracilimonas sp.]MBO6585637.1 cell division protein FtsQ/DivIB [Gracilimonas sp.]MBO6616634.1 cell division protein FtsQ/DivIB [Gracilimonas sp.]
MSNQGSNKSLLPWITTVLMVTGIAVLAALYWNRNVTVQDVQVNSLYYTGYEQVKQAADIPMGIKPDSLNLDVVVQRVEKLDYVRSVKPYIEPSGDLRLTVAERQPIALLVNGSDRMYVDAEGVRLPILDGKTQDVPLLYGYSTTSGDTIKTEDFAQVRDFLMRAKIDGFGWTTISEVVYDETDGVVALSHENGVKLLFGRNDFQTKLENWKAFYTDVIKVKGIQSMRQVDLRFTNQVVTREI